MEEKTQDLQCKDLYASAKKLVDVLEKYLVCRDTRSNLINTLNELKKQL